MESLIGLRFGRLTVLGLSGRKRYFVCRCDCGRTKAVFSGHLKRGLIASCGCIRSEVSRAKATTHGQASNWNGSKVSPTYKSWATMNRRCENPADITFKYYGARGIKVCARWWSFPNFLADMGERPAGKTLDRIDNDLGYFHGNCRWATPLEQRHNRRQPCGGNQT